MWIGLLVLMSSGIYVFVYLYRWEWNRALFAGMLFIATEVALATAMLTDKLRGLKSSMPERRADPRVVQRLHDAAPPPREPFAWLSPTDGRMGVFIPVLMGAGVVFSALAWLVERVARGTAGPVLEDRLAARLAPLSLPAGGLVGDDSDPVALLLGPVERR